MSAELSGAAVSNLALHELCLCRPEVLAVTWASERAFQEHCTLPAQAWGTAVSLGLTRSALRALLCVPVGLRHCSAPGPNAGPPGALTDLHSPEVLQCYLSSS